MRTDRVEWTAETKGTATVTLSTNEINPDINGYAQVMSEM
jgi:hypothetical protein